MLILWKKYSYVIMLIVLSLFIGLYTLLSTKDESNSYQEIIITEGQSLWKLAQIYSEEHSMNSQEFIDWVSEKNHLRNDIIKPGEKIVIPVKVKSQLNDKNQLALDLEKK
ncbi:cell division suppressor protein YneA [Heyndrickxia sp. NPDC080065]|uniref:cell division suppressor protein YneA n=1 Tax=Heyndrickxia sp. NPDC080065 TaxID=3390568 RepID=UPI003D02DD01